MIQIKGIIFSSLVLLYIVKVLTLQAMHEEPNKFVFKPLLADDKTKNYDSITIEQVFLGDKIEDVVSGQDKDYDSTKLSPFDLIPIELTNLIFGHCDPSGIGVNYLIHHYEPDQSVIDSLVGAKISSLLTHYHKDCDSDQKKIIDQLLHFQSSFPALHKKCKRSLSLIFEFEEVCSHTCVETKNFEESLKNFVNGVKMKAASLQWPEYDSDFSDLSHDLFLEQHADEYLEIHRIYLEHINCLLEKSLKNPKKPLGWNSCLAAQALGSFTYFSLNMFLVFFSISFDFEYKVPCIVLGSTNTIGGVVWFLCGTRMNKKSAIPGYAYSKNLNKKMQKALKESRQALMIGPQELRGFLVQEKENVV